jgi:hypothetical protein
MTRPAKQRVADDDRNNIAAHVKKLVDAAPALTPEIRDRIALLLRENKQL